MKTKFRAWDKENSTMLTWEQLKSEADFSWFADENLVFMQSTGLKDKNGVEIFEGDILTTEQYPYQVEGEYNYHGVVEWDKESAGYIVVKYVVNPLISGISNGMADRFEEVDGFEVIGNIYENPEWLEAHT